MTWRRASWLGGHLWPRCFGRAAADAGDEGAADAAELRHANHDGDAMKLANRVAVITGAAQGIGAACARVFAEQGARVVIGDVNEVGAAALAKEIAAAGGYAVARRADVGLRSDCEALVEFAVTQF